MRAGPPVPDGAAAAPKAERAAGGPGRQRPGRPGRRNPQAGAAMACGMAWGERPRDRPWHGLGGSRRGPSQPGSMRVGQSESVNATAGGRAGGPREMAARGAAGGEQGESESRGDTRDWAGPSHDSCGRDVTRDAMMADVTGVPLPARWCLCGLRSARVTRTRDSRRLVTARDAARLGACKGSRRTSCRNPCTTHGPPREARPRPYPPAPHLKAEAALTDSDSLHDDAS